MAMVVGGHGHGEGWAHGKVAQYLPRLRSMATAPMVVNANHSTNASNGLPANCQYISGISQWQWRNAMVRQAPTTTLGSSWNKALRVAMSIAPVASRPSST